MEKDDFTSILLIMQHYGIPTRLLDWTLNPQTALFFALNYNLKDSYSTTPAAIWFMHPVVYRSVQGIPGGVYRRQDTPDVNRLSYLAFTQNKNQKDSMNPVVFYPNSIFPRIIAQESIFSVHGCNPSAFEDLEEANSFLRCIVIRKDDRTLYDFVNNVLKLDYEKYFPDIYGFAEALRRAWHK
ncbi:MAG: FRG domain-containing protein [Eubacteriales bacterium]